MSKELYLEETVGPNDVTEVFDSQATCWNEDPEINELFLRTVHNFMLDSLRARGHVFLNDIHDQLGMPRTPIGQIRGWLLTDERRDSLNSFSFWKIVRADGSNDSEGYILSFSTDGSIFDRI